MTVWEKTLINLQKGYGKLMSFTANASERIKAEITIVRLRMQIDALRGTIGDHHRSIGKKLLEMRDTDALPGSFALFFTNSEITAHLEKIERAQKDLEILLDDLRHESDALKAVSVPDEERSA
ncbi:MAG: hypothetical protein AABZ15_09740 [Nitrospirota bacterium]